MTSHEFERTAIALAKRGYFVHLRFRGRSWHCELHNSVLTPHRLPTGEGATAVEAMCAARNEADELEGPKR